MVTADFHARAHKFDAHVHANTDDHQFLDIARKDGFELLSINVDYPDFPAAGSAGADRACACMAADPRALSFRHHLLHEGFGRNELDADTDPATSMAKIARGALAVKVWKNVGMVEKDAQGRLIMLDDPGFDGVMGHLEARAMPLIAHQAEPKNCWLPLEQMTTDNDRSYFQGSSRIPHVPASRAAELREPHGGARPLRGPASAARASSARTWRVWNGASMRWRSSWMPIRNAAVDLAARMTQVQYQSQADLGQGATLLHPLSRPHPVRDGSHRRAADAARAGAESADRRGNFTHEADASGVRTGPTWPPPACSTSTPSADVKGLALPKPSSTRSIMPMPGGYSTWSPPSSPDGRPPGP